MTKDEAERAKRLEKLQSTLHAVQMPQADQQLVGYHRERRPLAEDELDQASVSGLISAGSKAAPKSELMVFAEETPPLTEERGEGGDPPESPKAETDDHGSSVERVSGASGLNETLYDRLADQVENFRRPRGSKRITVAVSEDVFSRVSHLAFSRELDKMDILTFLLHRHLGDLSADKIPKWLSAQSKGPNRIDFLSFVQTSDLAKTIALLQARLGINKVDIVEKLVLQWLPRAPFTVPAKQKRKSTRRV
jgi:hypothetical protein